MLLNSLIFLLLSNSITSRRDKSIMYSRIAITILIISALIAYDNLSLLFLAKGIGIFGGLFHTTATTITFHVFIFLITSVILLLTSFYPRKVWLKDYSSPNRILFTNLIYYGTLITNKMGEQFKIIEYSLLILFIVTGSVFLISTSDLVSIFLSIELQSYGLYLLSTVYRDSEPATYGGLMYFLLGGLSSCFILLSTALLYANSGTTNLDSLYIITSISNASKDNLTGLLYWYKPYYIHISLLFMGVGFLFKVSAAPFHFWSPDVYDAIPTVVTTFVAIIAKISIFIFLLELVHYTGKSVFDMDFSWTTTLLFSSLLSLVIGTVVGLTQSRIKRLFAFSTISHVGFMLLGLTWHIALVGLELRKYRSDPIHFCILSDNLRMSGFYTGKGKGKQILPTEQESITSQSNSDHDSDDDIELRKAIALSLQQDKKGESSKGEFSKKELYKDDSPVEKNDFEFIAGYTQSWKTLNDRFNNTAKIHNELKIALDKQTTKDESDIHKLAKYLEETKQLRAEMSYVENKLSQFGVNPSEQFSYNSESDTTSNYSSYSSEAGLKKNDYSSDRSDTRPGKRVKYSNSNNNITDMSLIFSICKGVDFTFILRFISVIASTVLLLVVHLNIFPNLTVPVINISLANLLSIYFIVSLIKLMCKLYNTIVMLHNSYMKKDYFIIYANLFFSIIFILLSFSSNCEIYIFYV